MTEPEELDAELTEPFIIGTLIPTKPSHRTVRVTHYNKSADIDVELAPLIGMLWQMHVYTDNCCQDWSGRPGCVWLSFSSVDDMHRFVLRVLGPQHRHNEFYDRVLRNNLYPQNTTREDDWRYRLYVEETSGYSHRCEDDKAYAMPKDYDYGPKAVTSSVQITFPRKDLEDVCLAFNTIVGHDPHWNCEVCGREYTNATAEEIAIWNTRIAATGFCCDYCREDNEDPELEHEENINGKRSEEDQPS